MLYRCTCDWAATYGMSKLGRSTGEGAVIRVRLPLHTRP